MKNKKAFTLAEVLITLGVIGVVAAMTIPTLMTNIRAAQYRNKFKKTVSTLSQAVRMAQAQYDFDFADLDYPFAEGMEDCAKQDPEKVKTICSLFNGTLSGVTYLGKVGDNKELSNTYSGTYFQNDKYLWQLSDGTLIAVNLNEYNYKGYSIMNTISAYIDVNGTSKPNKNTTCDDLLGFDEGGQENPCIVKNKDINDIFQVGMYNSTVIPYDNAGAYVLNTAK